MSSLSDDDHDAADVDVDVDADVDADADNKDDAISYAVAVLLTNYSRHILNSIVESEAIYLECLSVSLQYMKAMKVKVMRLSMMMILQRIMIFKR